MGKLINLLACFDLYQDPIELRKWIIKIVKDSAEQCKIFSESCVDDLKDAIKESFKFIKDTHLTIPDKVGEEQQFKTLGNYIQYIEDQVKHSKEKINKKFENQAQVQKDEIKELIDNKLEAISTRINNVVVKIQSQFSEINEFKSQTLKYVKESSAELQQLKEADQKLIVECDQKIEDK